MISLLKKIFHRLIIYYSFIAERICIKRQIKEHSDKCLVYIPEDGIGDVCIALTYLNSFRKKVDKKIILFLCNLDSLKTISSLYKGYDEVRYVRVRRMTRIAMALSHWKRYEKYHDENKLIIVSPWPYLSIGILHYKKLDCLGVLADTVYRLNDKCAIEFPNLKASEIPAIGNKKILFNLFSNSMTVPVEIFSPIVEYFKSLGYETYTNCRDEKSYCMPATKPYICTITELYQNIRQFEYIVSIRSGILDFLASTGVKQIVFYNGVGIKNFVNLYSMKMWGCVDALELMYDDKDAMQKIKAYVEGGSES